MFAKRLALIVLFIGLQSSLSLAQDVTNEGGIGFPVHGVFSGSDFDSVQLNNGNLHIEIPLWKVNGRGIPVAMKMIYDNKTWKMAVHCPKNGVCTEDVVTQPNTHAIIKVVDPNFYGAGAQLVLNGCGMAIPGYTHPIVTEPDGTQHLLKPDNNGTMMCSYSGTLYAGDGSGWLVQLDPNGSATQAARKDGASVLPISANVSAVTDANGNQITEAVVPPRVITDTLGRTYATDGSYTDTNGVSRTLSITYTTVPISTHLCAFRLVNGDGCNENTGMWTAPNVITLPNGTSYTFQYEQNQYGEPNLIILPTGGQIALTWNAPQDGAGRTVASRAEISNGVTTTWNYAYTYSATNPTTQFPHILTATVTDPAQNDTRTTFTCMPSPEDAMFLHSGPCYETKRESFQGSSSSGTKLKTVDSVYSTFTNGASVVTTETTTWNQQNLVSKIETDWDSFFVNSNLTTTWRNVKERREFGFGVGGFGSLVRKTHYNYLHLDATNASTYRALNIAERPISKVEYDNSGTNIVAQTTYAYDGGTINSTSGTPAPNHDYVHFGSGYNTRGNLTQVSGGLKVGSTWTWLNTSHTFDDLGNTLTTKDPNLNQTSFSYADNWADANCTLGTNTFAYLTQTTDALSHQTKHKYFRCMGLVAGTQDQNDINNSGSGTTFTYDLVSRPLTVNYPDGGQTTNSYVDTVPLSVTQLKLVATGLNIQHTSVFDGLGRLQQTQFKDPDCTTGSALVKVDRAYGYLTGTGEFTQVSTPYCDIPNSVYGLMATTQHDALDRVTSVTQTDGSAITTTYSGTSAGLTNTVTDETGKARKNQTDALGRLTAVWEDPSVLNYETDYSYDTLDNLSSVTQQGGATSGSWRKRSFTYDSLSRLKCAANPEVTSSVNTPASCPATDTGTYTPGTIGYTYDNDGNVLTKTAPAPNQTGTASTAVANYSYDALNRHKQESYTGGASTPSVQFAYDGNSPTGCATGPPALSPTDANPVLYRTAMCDGSGATSWSHDAMGRELTEQRIINGTSAINNAVKYLYYKDGELNTLTYPGSGRVITYTANGSGGFTAGRPLSAVDSANSINYVTSATYAPQGALASLTNGTSIQGAFSYNSRLQPLQMYYGTNTPLSLTGSTCPSTVGNILHRIYNFNVGTSDNGNVLSITNCRDTNRTQNVTYDSLNRITTAATQGVTCTSCWGQRFGHLSGSTFVPGIDAWGNLFEITVTQGSAGTLSQGVTLNNQFLGMTYDASGNLTNDGGGHSFTFDDENRLTAAAGYTYVYDGDGKRVKKCSSSGCTSGTLYWTGTGSDALAEAGVGGGLTEEYIFINGERVARRDASGGAVHYYFSDHLKSADAITSNVGTIQEESDYYPYGGEVVVTGSDINNYKFTGKERDSESGLDMFGARYYGSSLGRFMTPDWAAKPITVPYANFGNPQSLNLYSYVQNNPSTVGDPDGHCPSPGDDCSKVKVEAKVTEQPKIIQNQPVDGANKTGVKGIIQDTITVSGKTLNDTKVDEKNASTSTLNGTLHDLGTVEGPSKTNNAGQVKDTVGLLAPAGTPAEDKSLVQTLQTGAVTMTNTNTITFTTPGGDTCSCTATRTLTNVGPGGKPSLTYTLDPGHPVVTRVEPKKDPQK
jgi:RHS repeat-associated protein